MREGAHKGRPYGSTAYGSVSWSAGRPVAGAELARTEYEAAGDKRRIIGRRAKAEDVSLAAVHGAGHHRRCMTPLLCGIRPRLVIVEGIMGAGKSTTVPRIADRLQASGVSVLGITEGTSPHPIRFDWDPPCAEMPATHLATSAAARWRAYADSTAMSESITVVDGQLFHGNLTSLFLLEADTALIRGYLHDVAAAIRPLRPFLVYFHQDDVDQAIRAIGR